jgi:hypothetical protein
MPETVKVRFTQTERDLILEHRICMDPRVEERIRQKKSSRGSISIELSQEELTDLIDSVAAEANHAKQKGLASALHEICDRLESLESEPGYW